MTPPKKEPLIFGAPVRGVALGVAATLMLLALLTKNAVVITVFFLLVLPLSLTFGLAYAVSRRRRRRTPPPWLDCPIVGAAITREVFTPQRVRNAWWDSIDRAPQPRDSADRPSRPEPSALELLSHVALDPGEPPAPTPRDAPRTLPPREPAIADRWANYKTRFAALQSEYLEAEMSPETWLYRPLLRDVTDPCTGTFHEKFAIASDVMGGSPPETLAGIDHAGTSLHAAESAWRVAVDNASEVGVPVMSADQRAQLRRAQRALAVALDERASRPEREASLVAARDLAQQIFEAVMPRHKKAIDESFQKQAKAIGLRRLPQLEA